jgi:hypothetical protein
MPHRNQLGERFMIRTSCYATLVSVSLITLSLADTASGALTIDSLLLDSEAIAGEETDSISETDFGFYNAIATYAVGLSEDYLASGVIFAEYFQSPLGPTLGVQLDALATAATTPGSLYIASVTGSAAINFTTSLDSTLFILDPIVDVTLTRISDNSLVALTDGNFLPAGSYQLYAEIFASPIPDGESIDAAVGLITFRMVPEPSAMMLLLSCASALCFRRS